MKLVTTILTQLGAETWGERFRRARDRSGLNVRKAAALVDPYISTSYATLARLERSCVERPSGRWAQIAFVALLAYGVNPAQFGLADLPECRALNAEAILTDLATRKPTSGTRWSEASRDLPTLRLAA